MSPHRASATAYSAAEIDELNERAWSLRLSAPGEGARVAADARAAARANGYARGEAQALRNAGVCRCMLLQHDLALEALGAAGEMFTALGDLAGKASTVLWSGNVHLRRSEFNTAQRLQTAALQLYRAAGDRVGEADALVGVGNSRYNSGDLPGALESYHAALQIAEEVGERRTLANCVNNIGNVYGRLGQFERALEHHQRALVLAREIGDELAEGVGLVNVGNGFEALEDYPVALDLYAAALEHARRIGDRLTEASALHELGEVHRKLGDYPRALDYYRHSGDVARAGGSALMEVESRLGLGQSLRSGGAGRAAVAELGEALALAERIGSRRLIYEAHLALSEAYEAVGDLGNALEHFRAFHRVEDEAFSADAERRIQAVLVKAEMKIAEREAELLRARNDELAAANQEKARLLDVLRKQAAELDRLSREDALTGLPNRRHVDAVLALEWERARRFGRDVSVAMVDLDRFKAVNDGFSHAVGDQVLRAAARILREGTRAVDVAGRWGGEEFVLLLVETAPEQAARVCEKLRAAFQAYDWSAIAPGLSVTASIGVGGNREGADPAAVLALADARLYAAKGAGRNRVVAG